MIDTGSLGISAALARVQEIRSMIAPPAAAAPATGFALPAAPTAGATKPASSTDPALAARLDEWMRDRVPDSPLVGMGAVFVREGQANGVDPRALVAIAAHESGLGTLGSGKDIHNAFGWGPAIPFASWEENIATVARGLRENYVDEGRTTIATIQGKWAPLGAANDPSGLNSSWTRAVAAMFGEMGGDPSGSVALAPGTYLTV